MQKINKKTEQQVLKNLNKKERYKYQKMNEKDKKEFINSLFVITATQNFESEFKND